MGPTEIPQQYTYEKLNGDREIRVLELLPGKEDESVRLNLAYKSLDALPPYEALSYTWGPITEKVDVVANASGNVLPVFANLHLILRHLRHPHEPRTMWIDAVCINQADVAERNKQVPLMREIYSCAKRVVAWVGEESDLDRAVFDIGNRAFDPLVKKDDGGPFPQLFLMVAGLTIMLRRPWFSRVWIIQEAALGRDLVLQCGSMTLEWDTFMAGCEILFQASRVDREIVRADQTLERIEFVDQVRTMTQASRGAEPTANAVSLPKFDFEAPQTGGDGKRGDLQFFITGARQHNATNPRDHIYGLLGLANDSEQSMVAVDYEKDELTVYSEFVTAMIQRSGNLNILGQAWAKAPGEPQSLPSWIPDWTSLWQVSSISNRRQRIYRASGDSTARVVASPETNILKLPGVFLDTIKEVTNKLELPNPDGAMESEASRSMLLSKMSSTLEMIGGQYPALKEISKNLKGIFTPKDHDGQPTSIDPKSADESIRQFVKVVQPGLPRAMFRLFAANFDQEPNGQVKPGGPLAMFRSLIEEGLPYLENVFLGPVHSASWYDTKTPFAMEKEWAALASKCKRYPTRETFGDAYWRALVGDQRHKKIGHVERVPPEWKDAYTMWHELVARTEGVLPRLRHGKLTKVREQIHPLILDVMHIPRPNSEKVPDHLEKFFRDVDTMTDLKPGGAAQIRMIKLYGKLMGRDWSDASDPPPADMVLSFDKMLSINVDSRPKARRPEEKEKETKRIEDAPKPDDSAKKEDKPTEQPKVESKEMTVATSSSESQELVQKDEKEKEDRPISIRRVARHFDRDVLRMAKNRRFCTTKKGYMGWAPPEAQAGDQICVLMGGQVLYIVRPVEGGHRYLGEAYVHGLMDGKALAMGKEEVITLK